MKILKTSNFMLVLLLAGTFAAPMFAAGEPDKGAPVVDPAAPKPEEPKKEEGAKPEVKPEEAGYYTRVINKIDEAGAEMPYFGPGYKESAGYYRTARRGGLCAVAMGTMYGAYKLVEKGLSWMVGEDDNVEEEEETAEPVAQKPVITVTRANAYEHCSAAQRKEADALLQKEKEAATPVRKTVLGKGRRRGSVQSPAAVQQSSAKTVEADKKRKNEIAFELMQKAVATTSIA